jgi:predicted small secreted protein
MRSLGKKLFSALLFLALATGFSVAQTDQGAGQDMKDAGHSTKQAAKKTGRKVKHGTKKGTHKAAGKTKQGAQKVEDKTTPQ